MSALRAGSVQGKRFHTYNSLILKNSDTKSWPMLETDDFPFPPATFTTRRQTASAKRDLPQKLSCPPLSRGRESRAVTGSYR